MGLPLYTNGAVLKRKQSIPSDLHVFFFSVYAKQFERFALSCSFLHGYTERGAWPKISVILIQKEYDRANRSDCSAPSIRG